MWLKENLRYMIMLSLLYIEIFILSLQVLLRPVSKFSFCTLMEINDGYHRAIAMKPEDCPQVEFKI
jgi:hypothetical protein